MEKQGKGDGHKSCFLAKAGLVSDFGIHEKYTAMAVMLTAHAHGLDTTVRSLKGGAVYYVHKDATAELPN